MSHASTNVHRVVAMSLRTVRLNDFVMHQFAFEQADGSLFELTAFADSSLSLAVEEESEATADTRAGAAP